MIRYDNASLGKFNVMVPSKYIHLLDQNTFGNVFSS